MENKPDNRLNSRKNEARALLKRCFKDSIFSLVPFEIWRDVVSKADLQSILILFQTCWGFKELVDSAFSNCVNLAFSFRREGQIPLALRCLQKCAENNVPIAVFHLGYAFFESLWGLIEDEEKAVEWFKKSADQGYPAGMAYYARCLIGGMGIEQNEELAHIWGKKALATNDNFAIAYCYSRGLGTAIDEKKELSYLITPANNGDEIAQFRLGACYDKGFGTEVNLVEGFNWYLKAAKQGHAVSQFNLGICYRSGEGVSEISEEKAIYWYKKSAKQGYIASKEELAELGVFWNN